VAVNNIDIEHNKDFYSFQSSDPRLLYIAATPKAKAVIVGKQMIVLLDSGAEVSVMDLDLMHELGLPVSTNVDLGMAQATHSSIKFMRIVEDVSVSVGRVKHRVPIWVAEDFSLGMLLERPYFVQARVETKDRGDGSCFGRILSTDGSRMIEFQAVSAEA
jgi:hypothetical protein